MVRIEINKENKAGMMIALSGNSIEVAKEVSTMLVEVCKAIAINTGNTFDEVFTGVVGGAKLIHFFETKKETTGE